MPETVPPVGTVHLVGAGPGDPGLLTLRGRELLAACEVLVYDALVSPEILAFCRPEAERVFVGKRGGQHTLEQDAINRLLLEQARAGRRVVRLKGGDPYLFGRGAEEALFLADNGVPVEVVPGITAGLAGTIYAGIPVTHREFSSAVAFVTGHEDPSKPESALDWGALAKVGTLCFYMGVKNLGRIAAELGRHLPAQTPVAVIEWASTPRQRTVTGTLADIEAKARAAGVEAPALTVVGAAVALHGQLNFFERRPLFGKRIVVTRARAQASELAAALSALGAETLLLPAIRIEPPADPRGLQAAARHLERFDWVVLTSVNGVDGLLAELARQGRDGRAFGAARIAAIGPATAARLAFHHLRADLVPPKYLSQEIVTELQRAGVLPAEETAGAEDGLAGAVASAKRQPGVKPPRFLLARGDLADAGLPERLRTLGADVTEAIAYRTVPETEGQEAALAALVEGSVDVVTFTSSSTAHNFARILGPERLRAALVSPRLKCLSIGPVTSAAMRELGLPVHSEAAEHDIRGLVRAVCEAAQGNFGREP